MTLETSAATLEKIISLCKRRGFVYPSAELYGGLNGVYDLGHLGVLLKQRIRHLWRTSLNKFTPYVFSFEGAILGPEAMWNASGHTQHFHDPMVDCLSCKHRYRADDIDISKPCPHCGNTKWTAVRTFNMMFQTNLGAASDSNSIAYLRPETAQSMYVNFKNVMGSQRAKVPFGMAQIGKAFRNEITPKQFLFRMREFEQMEMQWFCKPETSRIDFDRWVQARHQFYMFIGLTPDRIRLRPHAPDELAHYSTQCTDVEYHFPFGWKELEGIAHRGSFDLSQHMIHAKKDLQVYDEETKISYTPEIVECSVGVDRLFLTLLFDAYHEDIIEGEARVVLKFKPHVAPITVACLPLTKKQEPSTLKIYQDLTLAGLTVAYDDSGSIGKRYRRFDEIGTPFCITYDFDSDTDNCVTIRDRDTTAQQRIPIANVKKHIMDSLQRTEYVI